MNTSEPTTRVYRVPDISCDHCRVAIETNVSPVDGVVDVQVDVDAKIVTVTGGDDAAVAAAIDTAGYEIASE